MALPQYSVNDVAELTGISVYSIRYYDRIGLVVPKRDNAGQRVYSYYDILDLTRRNHYKEMGFSLRETEWMLSASSAGQIEPFLERKESELRRQTLLLNMAEHNLKSLSKQMKRLRLFLNKITVLERPSCWHVPHSRDGIVCQQEGSRKARELTGNSLYTFFFPEPSSNGWEDCANWDVTIDSPFAERIGFDSIPGSYHIPEELCLYSTFGVPGTEFIRREDIRFLYEYVEANGMKQNGTIYGRDIINRTENGEMVRYYEVWMPIAETGSGVE